MAKKKNAWNWKTILIITLIAALLILLYFDISLYSSLKKAKFDAVNSYVYGEQIQKLAGIGPLKSAHVHADFALFIGGKEISLNMDELHAPESGSVEFWEQADISVFTHLHEGTNNANVIHVHASGITLGMFFNSISGSINESCIVLTGPVESEYCDSGNKRLKAYINGKREGNSQSYVIKDLDKILVSYGDENFSEIQKQIESITNNACIQSAKC
jgi:hypothetical protein